MYGDGDVGMHEVMLMGKPGLVTSFSSVEMGRSAVNKWVRPIWQGHAVACEVASQILVTVRHYCNKPQYTHVHTTTTPQQWKQQPSPAS